MENTRLNKTRETGLMVELKDGSLVEQSKVKIEDVQNELPRFIKLAIGKEGDNWYLQTTDKLEETYLSYPIIKDSQHFSFKEIESVAKNLQNIFGLEIQYWSRENEQTIVPIEKQASLVKAVWTGEEVTKYLKENYSYIDGFSVVHDDIRLTVYGVFDRHYDLKQLSSIGQPVIYKRLNNSVMVKLEVVLKNITDSGLIDNTVLDMSTLVNESENMFFNESECLEYFQENTGNDEQVLKDHAKNQGIEIDENGNIILYEVGIGVGEFYDGRLPVVSYTTSKIDEDKNQDITLVKHLIPLNDGISIGTEFIDQIISYKEESDKLFFFDDEKAYDKYENTTANPPLILIKKDLQEIAEKIYTYHTELYAQSVMFNENKELADFSDEFDSLYDRLQAFVDKIKEK